MLYRLAAREITVRQAFYQVQMRLFNRQRDLNDDFDWTRYHLHYREELKSVSRVATLLPQSGDFEFSNSRLCQVNMDVKPLHPNHHLLYEIILGLAPRSVLEVGCGGGDHLRNLHFFDPRLKCFGVDRSEGQVATLRERHPQLPAELHIMDLTDPETVLPSVELVYSQAVLMHISETGGRFANALKNILRSARFHIVMIENWTEHDFLAATREAVAADSLWAGAKFYYVCRPESAEVRALVLSKLSLPFEELRDYDALLQGQEMRIH